MQLHMSTHIQESGGEFSASENNTHIQESGGEFSASENNQYSSVCRHDLQGDNLHWPRFQYIGRPQWYVGGM